MLLPLQKAFALSYASISLTRLSSLVATPLSARKRCYKRLCGFSPILASFVANPDLVSRLKPQQSLAQLDGKTLFGGGEQGYTDYP